ncbi:MAG: DUF4376 domain-containing protein [Selenomonadales bacterium]|nr:DUF4376 domain-containing protein [Selenomonadales bacterium]
MTFNIGQTFKETYPPEAAAWCNQNRAYMEVIEGGYRIVGIPKPTLDEVKTAKIASLKADRDRLEVEDIEVDGHLYDYDEKARERINNAIIALQASNGSILWTLADNNSVLVTAQDLIAVVSAVAVRSNALHVAYRDAKAKVNAAMTAEEVNAVALEV